MPQARVERGLAVILAADVAGYSRLIVANEEDVLARLNAVRQSRVDPRSKTTFKTVRQSCARRARRRLAPPPQSATVFGALRPSHLQSFPGLKLQIPSDARRGSDPGDGRRENSARSDCGAGNR